MRTRASWYAVAAAAVSLTSGCHWFRAHFPHVGWRLHFPCATCGPGAPTVPPARAPVVGFPVVPDCHGCPDPHPAVVHHPAAFPPVGPAPFGYPGAGYPAGGYPPVIGQPMPLPGATPVAPPPAELHRPAPVPGK
ncbi:MAG: hypothetical protein C0501_23905 [Isosphaera sp.]|nr:hypothetical protein [Isosphaera sp.]